MGRGFGGVTATCAGAVGSEDPVGVAGPAGADRSVRRDEVGVAGPAVDGPGADRVLARMLASGLL